MRVVFCFFIKKPRCLLYLKCYKQPLNFFAISPTLNLTVSRFIFPDADENKTFTANIQQNKQQNLFEREVLDMWLLNILYRLYDLKEFGRIWLVRFGRINDFAISIFFVSDSFWWLPVSITVQVMISFICLTYCHD